MELKRAEGSYKEILHKELNNQYPWSYPSALGITLDQYFKLNESIFKKQTALLDKEFSASRKSKWEIARIMYDIFKTGSYCSYYDEFLDLQKTWKKQNPTKSYKDNPYSFIGSFSSSQNPAVLLTFAKEKYGICKTDLYNMFAVIEKFGTQDGSIKGEVMNFSFYQLVEMLPLSYQQRLKVKPNWTIKEIREYKKSLNTVQTSGQAEDEDEEIQTSEQPPEDEKYKRFEKYTKIQLCDRIIELEEEIKSLKKLNYKSGR